MGYTREQLSFRMTWRHLDSGHLRHLIHLARDEDLAGLGLQQPPTNTGDATTTALAPTGQRRLVLRARETLVPCGLALIPLVLEAYGSGAHFVPAVGDGQTVEAGTVLGTLEGPASLLSAERVLLNFLQHLSGISTETSLYVAALEGAHPRLLDTRKTTPGYRMLEKYAVACGGGWNHRLGLFDRLMLKDNHLGLADAAEGAALALVVKRARAARPDLPLEVEVDSLDQVEAVVAAGADIVLLDNFSPSQIRSALDTVRGRALVEASGGITREKLLEMRALDVDFLSTGALVHHSRWVDIGVDVI